jgi:hypothetical protein
MELEGGFKSWREHGLPVESSLPAAREGAREKAEAREHANDLPDPPGYETLEERAEGPRVVH